MEGKKGGHSETRLEPTESDAPATFGQAEQVWRRKVDSVMPFVTVNSGKQVRIGLPNEFILHFTIIVSA